MRGALGGWRRVVVMVALLAVAAACGDDREENASTSPAAGRFACLDFVVSVTQGPSAGRTWSGDLILNADNSGAFTGLLLPVGDADRQTLEIRNRSRVICRAVGQRNGAQVSWFLYCGNDRIFGTGQITPVGEGQELRGITQGPTDRDFGVYHGRNYPPYIRIISPDFS
ncbi:MAG: hypothetical protein M3203_06720 [Actinomycetota bacterium]|nr:hypothetical protein [Actinomycetota bacterium]